MSKILALGGTMTGPSPLILDENRLIIERCDGNSKDWNCSARNTILIGRRVPEPRFLALDSLR